MLKKFDLINNELVVNEKDDTAIHIYTNPTAEEKQQIISTTNIDQHSLASALDPDEVSRIELKPDLVFTVWKYPENYSFEGEIRLNVCSIGLGLTPNRLLIILAENLSLFEDYQPYQM